MIHAVRVALGMATSFLVTSGIDLPHGVWASVSLLVVVGGLQHYGNIRKKAAERAIGTMRGAGFGLFLILVQTIFGSLFLFFLLMSVLAGGCAYYAIGKAGYVALFTAITMVIVSGQGDLDFSTELWRTANVLIGIVIALAFLFVLPQYAIYSWRYRLADNLRECAQLYGAMLDGTPLIAEETAHRFYAMSQRLVQSRALMESVAKETDVPIARLEEIQRLHRSILAALELLLGSMPDAGGTGHFALACTPCERQVRQQLAHGAGAALRAAVSKQQCVASVDRVVCRAGRGVAGGAGHALARHAFLGAGGAPEVTAVGDRAAMEHRRRAAARRLMRLQAASDACCGYASSSRCETTLTSQGTPNRSFNMPKP